MAHMRRANKIIQQLNSNQSSETTLKYAVFVCGPSSDELRDYGDMIIGLLQPSGSTIMFEKFTVYPPSIIETDAMFHYLLQHKFDGIIFSGSRFDAHSNEKWVVDLRQLVAKIYDYNTAKVGYRSGGKTLKMIGICFGHQLIAHALSGGLCGRNNKATWELGSKRIRLNQAFDAMFQSCSVIKGVRTLSILQSHRDAVLKLPSVAGCRLLASSECTDVEMYCIGKQIFCMQGHPEFDTGYVGRIIKQKYPRDIDDKESMLALASLQNEPPDNAIFKHLILHFLQQ